MKNIRLTAVLILLTSSSLYSQMWFEVAFRGNFGPTFLFNNNVSNDKHVNPELSYGNGYGARLGINFAEDHEVLLECVISSLSQKYKIKLDSSATVIYYKTIKISTLDFPIIYRHYSDNGGYVEIGPQFSLVKKASETNTLSNGTVTVLPKIAENYTSGVFGFGSNFLGAGPFTLLFGARFTYAFTDLISSVGGKSQTQSYPINDSYYSATYTSYKPTSAFTAMLTMEASFDIGYFVSSKCKNNRVKFLMF